MSLPSVKSAKVVFIKQFTLTNFVEKYHDLDKRFTFLANSDDYSKYYQNMELSEFNAEKKMKQRKIEGLGPLIPLKRKHTLRSFWKSFRLPWDNRINNTRNELFLLLPLKIKIPIKSIRVDNKEFPIKFYIYLFPFGSCCVNMEINIPVLDCCFDNFSKLISDMMIANFRSGKGRFESFSYEVAKKLNKALFADEEGVIRNRTHSFIFLDTSLPLSPDYPDHKKAIVAIMKRKKISDVECWTEKNLDKVIKCKLEKLNRGEILIFHPECTLIYPSSIWIGKNTLKRKINRKYKCMSDNYCSFINVIFAVNGFLEFSFLKNKDKLPKKRALEITKCFTTAFLKTPEGHYKNSFDKIASEIPELHINEHLKICAGELNGCN